MKTGIRIKHYLHTAILVSGLLLSAQTSYACDSECHERAHHRLQNLEMELSATLRETIYNEFEKHHLWFMSAIPGMNPDPEPAPPDYRLGFFLGYVAPALVLMTESLTVAGMHQMAILGTFFDAKHQLETQLLFQDLVARAHRDYHPSTQICTMGTAVRSMAATAQRTNVNAAVMLRRSQDRQLGYINTSAARGIEADRANRVEQFRDLYCKPSDMNRAFAVVCPGGGPAGRSNRDIDYSQLLGNARTLDVDFTDTVLTDDEEDLLALASNLFAHTPFSRVPRSALTDHDAQVEYMNMRSVVAKRSIVENSFYTIAAMKSAGSEQPEAVQNFVNAIVGALGIDEEEAAIMLGERPSYFALMELATQRIFQAPDFFVNLYDKPANVMRQNVAMQALGLMLDRDRHHSELRYESMLALWLELETMKYHESVQNRIYWLESAMESE